MKRFAWIVGIPLGLLALAVGWLFGHGHAEDEAADRPSYDDGWSAGWDARDRLVSFVPAAWSCVMVARPGRPFCDPHEAEIERRKAS